MSIQPFLSTSMAQATAGSSSAQSSSSASAISSDFDTFLRMLTVQMQNQDPLNPVDSSQQALQLATFSGVEQQVLTNDLLNNMISQIGMLGMGQLSGWVGMEARAQTPAHFSGAPVSVSVTPDRLADEVYLVAVDASGHEVSRVPIASDAQTVDWMGQDAFGGQLPAGAYSLQVESFASGAPLGTTPAQPYAGIVEARLEGTSVMLILEGGIELAAEDVTAMRLPD